MKKSIIIKIAMVLSALIGLVTIFAGGSVLLDLFGMRAIEGKYVLFVVWANFICGFLYLIGSYGFFKKKKWTATIMGVAFLILVVAYIGFVIWILQGKPHEFKTIMAMSFRTLLTFGFWWVATLLKKPSLTGA